MPRLLEFNTERVGSRTHLEHVVRRSRACSNNFKSESYKKEEPVSINKVTFCPPMVTVVSHWYADDWTAEMPAFLRRRAILEDRASCWILDRAVQVNRKRT